MTLPNLWKVRWLARWVFDISRRSRKHKLALFNREVRPSAQDLVLDVGVTSEKWSSAHQCAAVENFLEASYPWPERIVALSIDRLEGFREAHGQIRVVQGDACTLPFRDDSFDVVFTNAVIEHVGDPQRQDLFVQECLRVAPRVVFLAAPNRWFPYDTHVAFPLVHWLPRAIWKHYLNEKGVHLISPIGLLRHFPPASQARLLGPLWGPSVAVVARANGSATQPRGAQLLPADRSNDGNGQRADPRPSYTA